MAVTGRKRILFHLSLAWPNGGPQIMLGLELRDQRDSLLYMWQSHIRVGVKFTVHVVQSFIKGHRKSGVISIQHSRLIKLAMGAQHSSI